MCIHLPYLSICCRSRYDHDNNIIEIPELNADQKKAEIVSPTVEQPNQDRMKNYQTRNGSSSEEQICEATPLVQNERAHNDQKYVTETEPTLTTYVTKDTNLTHHQPMIKGSYHLIIRKMK